jgi:hypothetical protein
MLIDRGRIGSLMVVEVAVVEECFFSSTSDP